MDIGAWQAPVHGVTKSRTQLSDVTLTFIFKIRRNRLPHGNSTLVCAFSGKMLKLSHPCMISLVLWFNSKSSLTKILEKEMATHSGNPLGKIP